jgi:hypothetical protein
MRRVAASLLLLFSFSLIAPALAADPESNLPACCRRGGKHECQLRGASHSSGVAFEAAKCPFFPGARGVSAQPQSGAPVTVIAANNAPVRSYVVAHAQTVSFLRISFSRSAQKRGPPALLA